MLTFFFFQAEDGIRDAQESRGLGDVYKRQGLGAMGYPMAGHLNQHSVNTFKEPILVHNRTLEVAEKHSEQHGTVMASIEEIGQKCQLVFLCLPTSAVVATVLNQLLQAASQGLLIVDCTSGDPLQTRELASMCQARGHRFMDAPVSGGPAGAAAGKLAVLAGGSRDAVEAVLPWLNCFSKKVEHIGPVGAGHATKAVNNALNTTHLLAAAEGLLALQKFGIAPERALAAINVSSGRSLQTEQRIPDKVLTGTFDYGFKLGLMHKDLTIASALMAQTSLPMTTKQGCENYFSRTEAIYKAAQGELGDDADYTEAVKMLEHASGLELRASDELSLIHISEPTRLLSISYAVFCLKKKKSQHIITTYRLRSHT
eukprot:TRINITY_DN4607_c0_g1_i2.p1 TRINITY_DN4607_c0_g1~~TRINITY_DN4607_c0_g1_i2.p1  ORF type:complete len:371 (+),score=74.94 TRINITY_DN4607_c0_g1_i2:55-1167(+)